MSGALANPVDTKLYDCGCSVGACEHGMGSSGGTSGGISEIREQLEKNAQDQENSLPHYGKFVGWWEAIGEDLERLMADTHRDDLDTLRANVADQIQEVKRLETALHQSVEETRAMAERL